MTSTIVVIGAGVIGLAQAVRLQEAGHRVVVVEPRSEPSGASLANAGWVETQTLQPLTSPESLRFGMVSLLRSGSPLHIRPRPSAALAAWLMEFASASTQDRWSSGRAALMSLAAGNGAELVRRSRRLGFRINATESLSVYDDADTARTAIAKLGLERQPEVELLSAAEVLALEPGLTERARAGVLVRGDVQVEPRSLIESLAAAVLAAGGEIVRDRVVAFRRRGALVEAAVTERGLLEADGFVIAAGHGTPALARRLGARLRIEPRKGYSIAVRLPFRRGRVVNFANAKVGLVPTMGGSRLVGTMEFAGPRPSISGRRVRGIADAARPYIRDFATAEPSFVDAEMITVGLRPMSASGLPIIDRLPTAPNAYVSTGHSMMGVSLAFPSATALVDYIDRGARPPVLEPFRIRRT